MSIRSLALGAVLVGLLVSCGCRAVCPSRPPRAPRAHPPIKDMQGALGSDAALEGRLSAAMKINAMSMRNQALAGLAMDAARAGKGEFVRKALAGINVMSTRNEAASDCAFQLALAGDPQAAVSIAEMINVQSMRNQALMRIATLE